VTTGGPRQRRIVQTVRLDDARLFELLDRLDANQGGAARNRRRHERFSYRTKVLVVHIKQPGSGSPVAYLAPARNLSAGGVAFLHGGFLHKGTLCVADLLTVHGRRQRVAGDVVACRHVDGSVHEIGVKFREEIDPANFTLAAVHARVLLVEDDPTHARLAMHYLRQLNAEVDLVQDGRSAVQRALVKSYDLILLDMVLPKLDGFAAVQELRTRGYTGKVVAVTALTQPGDAERCLAAGCDRYVAKPYTRDQLIQLLTLVDDEPLFSTLSGDPTLADLAEEFVRHLPQRIRELEEALVATDEAKLIDLLRRTKADGGSFGFDPISQAAAQAEQTLAASGTVAVVREQVRQLLALCRSARPRLRRRTCSQARAGWDADDPVGFGTDRDL